MKASIVLFLSLFISGSVVFCQTPTDNPYRSRYRSGQHWTDSLPWKNVTNAAKVKGLIGAGHKIDSAVLHQTMKEMSKNGGGVLYFGPGEYFLNFDMKVSNNVILRGADPVGIRDAKNSQYRPPTKFQFPEYVPSFVGAGTPDYTAFKDIESEEHANFGLVNIDINRALLWVPESNRSNIIIFGIRSNNAVDYRSIFLAGSRGKKWERYPTGTGGNLMITFYKGVIANCRINDAITDDFEMQDFMSNEGYVFRDVKIKFQYGLQAGIRAINYADTCELELLDNYARGYKVADIEGFFTGKKIVRNNQFEFLPCQDLITSEFYSKEQEQHTDDAFGKELSFIQGSDTLKYLILKPLHYDPAKKYPFVLFLHGNGQHGKKDPLIHFVSIFSNDSIRSQYPYFVLVPHIGRNEKFSTSLDKPATKSLQMSIELMKKLEEQYSIDTNRTFVSGISSGGIAGIETVVRYPELFKTAILMSAIRRLNGDQMKRIKDIRFIISVGTKDNDTPLDFVRQAVAALRKQGNKVEYFEYEEVGHWSWLNVCSDQQFLSMMFK